jgi:hypothetical protein
MNTEKHTDKLIFVYNADSGLFNTMSDIAHKLFSPSTYECQLCALTHGLLKERGEWRDFIESFDVEVEFLHRDQFREQYPAHHEGLPAVFLLSDGELSTWLPTERIRACSSLSTLTAMIGSKLQAEQRA